MPASRADHAARLLLGNMALWETLAGEDHAMLCALPAPHGPLFAWLESQFHEQGALGWSTLREHMQDQPFAGDATRWMAQDKLSAVAGSEDATPPDLQEARQELRRLLTMLMIDRLKQLETEALTQASTGQDPEAQQRWRSLHERRKALREAWRSNSRRRGARAQHHILFRATNAAGTTNKQVGICRTKVK